MAKSNYRRLLRGEENIFFSQEIANRPTRNWHVGALQDDALVLKSDPPVQNNKSMMGLMFMCSPSIVASTAVLSLRCPLPPLHSQYTNSQCVLIQIDLWNYRPFSMILFYDYIIMFPKIIWNSHMYMYIYILYTHTLTHTYIIYIHNYMHTH